MSLIEKILGPKSKYDKSIPYTYEARIRIIEGSDEYNCYFSDTICGLVEYLHQNGIKPEEVQIIEVYQERELPIDVKLFTTPDHQWLFKPDICRSFEEHYKGHIQENTCTFNDRECKGSGP
ncbi:MAG: hypothetical protein A3H31_06225 [Gallionellales bacterium RIFCSPLOWO2_02_FULL_57_47]|nr:MAG: hypothetical protein A3H31_06225 [Gallionellales bacterium RIFCSPLOWO2_02_FULL_57_47]OGT16779.1 MAG: hypothetical protein A3J49_00495 [Gallionellales bacterium RIFCSPHIGHO2_02_FULL_57_16]